MSEMTTAEKCAFPDQAAADRERIAEEMCKADPGHWWTEANFRSIGNAVRAFEVLCEPAEWVWWCGVWPYDGKIRRIWWARKIGIGREIRIDGTCNHAADVCRLVCEVLDRERPEAPQSPRQAD